MISTPFLNAPIRALFLDIDGTLVGRDDRVSPAVVAAIQAARARGCLVALCTGRTRFRIRDVVEQISPPYEYAVTSNGGVVVHTGTREVLLRRLLPVPIALDVVRSIVAGGSEPYVFEDSDVEGIEGARVLFRSGITPGDWAELPRYRPYDHLVAHLPFAPVSVSAFGPPEIMRPLAAGLREQLASDVSVVESGTDRNWGVEVYVKGVSKRLGLETVAARLDVNREEIMAIGDHINDLEMIRWAGLGVAMGNAIPQIRAAADWVTESLVNDGVAAAIERFVLEGN